MQRMWSEWILRKPQSGLTTKQLVAPCANIHKRQLQSQLEIEEVQHKWYCTSGTAQRSQKVRRKVIPTFKPEIGNTVPVNIFTLSKAATDLSMTGMNIRQPQWVSAAPVVDIKKTHKWGKSCPKEVHRSNHPGSTGASVEHQSEGDPDPSH